jgi:NADH-quinone oxidoreductase subunit G
LSDKQVALTIDGRPVAVPAGTLVIRAADAMGIYVPRFCDHPYLAPLGACRQCMVEIEGQRKPVTSCTTPVAEGMVIKTQHASPMAAAAQLSVLELLLINHPLDCPMCDKGGECPLQDQALAYGPGRSRFLDVKRRFLKPVPVNPLVYLDRERCVLCARCTRFAAEISGDPFIELFERGALEQVAVFEDEPYDSHFSGNVIQICPVGALTSRDFRFKARPFDMTSSPSVCGHCASGCALTVQERRGEIVRVLAADNPEVNDTWTCDVGRFGHAFVSHPERVASPLVRKDGAFVAVSWAEAIRVLVEKIALAREAGSRIGVLAGGRLVDEDAYALSRFARTVLSTNDVDWRPRPGGVEEDEVLARVLRSDPATYQDIDAARVILIAGCDVREESPILYLRIRKAAARGARVLEVNPRKTALAKLGRSVQPFPGTEAEAISSVVEVLAGGGAVILAGERLARSPGALAAAWNAGVATGSSFGWVPRRAGARGALWAGLHPAMLPGGRRLADSSERAEVEQVWSARIPANPGLDSTATLEAAAAGSLGLLILVGVDPAADFPNVGLARRALGGPGARVALDMFLTESSRAADVVLPAAAVPERDGTLTDWEGRAQPFLRAVEPAGLSVPDWEILLRVATELEAPFPAGLFELRREMAALARPPGHREPVEVEPRGVVGRGSDYPLALISYPLAVGDGTLMAGADDLVASAARPFVEIHPADARIAGVSDGERVRVTGPGGAGSAEARVRASVPEGAVFVPADQPGLRAGEIADLSSTMPGVRIQRLDAGPPEGAS